MQNFSVVPYGLQLLTVYQDLFLYLVYRIEVAFYGPTQTWTANKGAGSVADGSMFLDEFLWHIQEKTE